MSDNQFPDWMPDRETPQEPPVDSLRPGRANSSSQRRKVRPHPTSVDSSTPRGKPLIVIGAPADIPRALAHPGVMSGQFVVIAAIAVEITDEGVDPSNEDVERLNALLRTEKTPTLLLAGPVGSRAVQYASDLAAEYRCDLLAVMPTDILPEHEPAVVWSGDASFVELAGARRHAGATALKRAADIVIALIGLIVTLPLLAITALAIRLESPGSPVFRHERVGRRGRRFLCLKLRTMRVDAEDRLRADSEMYEEYRRHHFKIPDDRDPRVTRLGRWLRRTSVDELPQLWNVLVGEMSLVGPRPVVTDELELYGREKGVVLSVRPGITGAWAVSGRQRLGYPERCAIELRYVRGWRLGADLRILAKTIVVVGRSFAPPV